MHIAASIDIDTGAGCMASHTAGQEGDNWGNIMRFCDVVQGNILKNRLLTILSEKLFCHISAGETWC